MNADRPVASVAALARLAAHGLPGAANEPIVVGSLPDLLATAEKRHALSWVSDAVAADLVANATDEFIDDLRTRHLGAVRTTMAAHAAAAAVLPQLTRAGIDDAIVLKGCATGHLDYVRSIDRFSTDVDLLLPEGGQVLVARVFPHAPIPPPRRRGWQERYGKATTIVDEHGVELDLHVTITDGYFGLVIPGDELRQHTQRFEIAGTPMTALDGPGRLLHAAIHIANAPAPNLNSARDVLQLVLVSHVDWRATVERAARWEIDALFAAGVRRAWAQFHLEPTLASHPILRWASAHQPSGRQRLAMSLVGERPRGQYLTAPLAIPARKWPGYVGPMLFPSRSYLADNGLTWRRRTRRLLAELKFW